MKQQREIASQTWVAPTIIVALLASFVGLFWFLSGIEPGETDPQKSKPPAPKTQKAKDPPPKPNQNTKPAETNTHQALVHEVNSLEGEATHQAGGGGSPWWIIALSIPVVLLGALLGWLYYRRRNPLGEEEPQDEIPGSQQKPAFLQLQRHQTHQSMDLLAQGVAHDFNNQLIGVIVNADMALTTLHNPTQTRECLEDILEAAKEAASLCQLMMFYAGRSDVAFRTLKPTNYFTQTLEELCQEAPPHVEVELDIKATIPEIQADPHQLTQAMTNMLRNSIEAIGDQSGTISITVGTRLCAEQEINSPYLSKPLAAGHYLYIQFSDDGAGINMAALPHIFDPFYTTHEGHKGLGLSMVLGAIKSHGGSVVVESTPGKGSHFTLLFPASDTQETSVTQTTSLSETPARTPHKGTVLLVEDSELVLRTTSRLLEHSGYQVLSTERADSALQILKSDFGEVDFVLLDLAIPGDNCAQTIQNMRKISPDMTIALCSGYNVQNIDFDDFPEPPDLCIQKPFVNEELLQIIASHCTPKNKETPLPMHMQL